AELRADAAVARIRQQSGRIQGVTLESGEKIDAPQVISAANPRSTFFDLLGTDELDIGFVRRVKSIRMKGNVAKIHLALDGPPEFTGLPQERLRDRLLIAPSVDYVDLAFNPAKYGEASERPALELVVPTVSDPNLAPPGCHVLSAAAIYAPYALKAGWSAPAKDAFLARAIETIEAYAPGLSQKVVAGQILTPDDLERDYRMTGGHWHHGELAIDQMFMLRPAPGAAQYATPIEGLFLCGAGSHPGGGVTGAAGMNAARAVLEARA
ncbi:MAG: phytoene desaturase family protein, partial [Kiloniellales bacterium]